MDRDYSFLDSLDRGMYFDKKEYDGAPLLSYEEVKDRLPVPIVSSHPEWVFYIPTYTVRQRAAGL